MRSKNSVTSMYPDDETLCLSSKNVKDMNEAIRNHITYLGAWINSLRLSRNAAKTREMLICTKNKHQSLEVAGENLRWKIRDKVLALVLKTKYIGVHVDSSLDGKQAIISVPTKISREAGLLKCAKILLISDFLKTLNTSIVEPHFLYFQTSIVGCCGITEISNFRNCKTEQL